MRIVSDAAGEYLMLRVEIEEKIDTNLAVGQKHLG